MKNKILSYLDIGEADMFSLLKKLVLQRSYTLDRDDVNHVGILIRQSLNECGMHFEQVDSQKYGNHLIFRSPACETSDMAQIMLVGHMDTVFPREMNFASYTEDEDHVYGPGVIDMKGGLVTAIYAIKALAHAGLLHTIPLVLVCNSEEEKGSPESKKILCEEAEKSLMALVFECGGMKGEVVTGRKGKFGFTVSLTGEAGHAAFAGNEKASSILELAHKIIALEKLNDPAKQIVVNVGQVHGGIGPNTVPENALAHIDCRFVTKEDGDYCITRIKQIIEESTVNGVSATWEIPSSRAVMNPSPENRKILQIVQESAVSFKQTVDEEFRSGVSDANTLAGCSIPVLDGLGPIGRFDHSDREYMIKTSLLERTKLTAVTLLKIYERQLAGDLF